MIETHDLRGVVTGDSEVFCVGGFCEIPLRDDVWGVIFPVFLDPLVLELRKALKWF